MKLGLVLGSGAARGWAHIGVIEALEEGGIQPDLIAGTSIGSVVGGAYASGRMQSLKAAALSLDWKRMLYYVFGSGRLRSGLVDGERVRKFIGEHLNNVNIEDLPIPFRCVATDALSGDAVVFDQGDLLDAIRASLSIPGIFTPVYRDGCTLIDGGVVNPVPVDEARKMGADLVVAVDINHGRTVKATRSLPTNYLEKLKELSGKAAEKSELSFLDKLSEKIADISPEQLGHAKEWLSPDPTPNIFDIIGNSIRIMEARITESSFGVYAPDVLIRPDVGKMAVMEFHHAEEAIAAGYLAGQAAVEEIKQKLGS